MGTGTRTTAQYRDLATQCLERAQSAQTKVERLYFLEQAAVWHRLAAAGQDDGASNLRLYSKRVTNLLESLK
jgi:hypothetical protein